MLILLSVDIPESCLSKEDIIGSEDIWAGSPTSEDCLVLMRVELGFGQG